MSKFNQHAPRPWHKEGYRTKSGNNEPADGFTVFDAYQNPIADMPRGYIGNGANLEANARLIAAAPQCNCLEGE